ncbi:MAG TPA: LPS-assembly protein LptD, partial [Cyclobacteriaceae bacterium]|nr:LPS-assembly protein LptD [Cyclobacteriaceae bacterium]
MIGLRVKILLIFLLFLTFHNAAGQVEKRLGTPRGDLPARTVAKSDTVKQKIDSLKTKMDSIAQRKRRSDIETTIAYSALDSINSSVDRKIVRLYGDAKIKYGLIELKAEEITIDYEKSTISATGKLDSLGRRVGYPVFVNGSETYETKSIIYNFKNKKALISEVVTK